MCELSIGKYTVVRITIVRISGRCELARVKLSGLYCTFITIVRIIWEVRISEGQIICAILYIYNNCANYLGGVN